MVANSMNVSRRILLGAASGLLLPRLSHAAAAEEYPKRPVRMLVGLAAGGSADVTSRVIGKWMSEHLGQSFFVENRTGAGGNIAAEEAIRAAPDGYTLLYCASGSAINASVYHDLKFNFIRDTAPVAGMLRLPDVMLVNPSLPVKSVRDFIDYAKANPGKINFASPGIGSSQHLAGELFKIMTGVEMVHVPYRGGAPAAAAVLGGEVQVYFGTLTTALTGISAGLRALAITTKERAEVLPDVPPLDETVPGYDVSSWFGMSAPKGTPEPIIARLNEVINAGLSDPGIKQRFVELGGFPMVMSPAEFGEFVVEDTERWAGVVRSINLTVQ
jgi:tripartite-type tricarboxylate transporter receptor subunit TctC